MKKLLFICSLISLTGVATTAQSQDLQLHYDLRHSVSPGTNPENFPTLYFEYWKKQDSGRHLIKPGDFLLKTEADLLGAGNNIGKFYFQASQSFRAWNPKVFLQLQYSGGGGITEPKQYSYYITNTYQAGLEFPWRWKNAWLTTILDYKYVSYSKPTNDPIFTQYWYIGLLNYKLEFAGDFSIWTENKDQGIETTPRAKGKRAFFFAEPQLWYNLTHNLALGSKLNCYYHVNTATDVFQAYPTLAVKVKL
jgi:Domain of unknown function (DUF5020)